MPYRSGLYKFLRKRHAMAVKLPNSKQVPNQTTEPNFTSRLLPKGCAKSTLFEKELARFGIRHKLIHPYTPRHNGKVERSHRKDNEEFYASHRFFSFDYFKAQLAIRERAYNNFPMRPLKWRSPKQLLSSFPFL